MRIELLLQLGDSSSGKVQRQWREIRQILVDNSAHHQQGTPSSSGDPNSELMIKDLFKQRQGDADTGVGTEKDQHEEEVVVDAADEHLVNQVLKNKLYDDITDYSNHPDMTTNNYNQKYQSTRLSGNQQLRHPHNKYERTVNGIEARSIRRPEGEKGWK